MRLIYSVPLKGSKNNIQLNNTTHLNKSLSLTLSSTVIYLQHSLPHTHGVHTKHSKRPKHQSADHSGLCKPSFGEEKKKDLKGRARDQFYFFNIKKLKPRECDENTKYKMSECPRREPLLRFQSETLGLRSYLDSQPCFRLFWVA